MKILITGGAGHIGGSLGAALARRGDCQVVLVDNLSTGTKSNLPSERGHWTFIKADANNFEDMAAIMTASSTMPLSSAFNGRSKSRSRF